ncbi:radical SAM family heme chaperone HemW [Kiritimatiella glycovorans]|uniref:Heme chaperone HemW n=1 Tax=Kiritimatiella glycovorans TaxID=1307763 RepID=A0A0G3EC74_9BACT|nr:radical SAM family heme chaperone HemW [Kiritimatiella glycovorans]AKJ64106.1 putative oxygen-independent coproporphyrinogen-III oxidase 1 [Kiritimatiella glycovorans]
MPGLYIHIPFCLRKCPYCDFYSIPLRDGRIADRYLNALGRELRLLAAEFRPATVYVGGGTPTALEPEQLRRLFRMLHEHAGAADAEEVTCEANPGTMERETLDALLESGVNRISVGVQSFCNAALKKLGRVHSAEQAWEACRRARSAGFGNMSIDLIGAVPGVRRRDLRETVDRVLDLRPEHISFYLLSFEEGTLFHRLRERGAIAECEEEEQVRRFDYVRGKLRRTGYRHYEISNFAVPGFESRHNLLYWDGEAYAGCGAAAHSFLQGERRANVRDLETYLRRLEEGAAPVAESDVIRPEARARELLVMGLRKIGGVERETFRETTGYDYWSLCGPEITDLARRNLLEVDRERIRLTGEALLISDTVFAELI